MGTSDHKQTAPLAVKNYEGAEVEMDINVPVKDVPVKDVPVKDVPVKDIYVCFYSCPFVKKYSSLISAVCKQAKIGLQTGYNRSVNRLKKSHACFYEFWFAFQCHADTSCLISFSRYSFMMR